MRFRRNKYGNRKTTIDGITFDSAREANRYAELKLMEKAGVITNLQRQVPFVLQDKFVNHLTGKVEREIKYVADFTYDKGLTHIIEDVKSDATRKDKVYRMKKKMMAYRGWYISEV